MKLGPLACMVLAGCALRVPEPTGVETAIYVVAAARAPDESVRGTLVGPGRGACFVGTASGRMWWVFQLDSTPGRYRCVSGTFESPPLDVEGAATTPSAGLHGEYRCGVTDVRIDPPVQSSDGSEAFLRFLPIPCAATFPGPALPFEWGAGAD